MTFYSLPGARGASPYARPFSRRSRESVGVGVGGSSLFVLLVSAAVIRAPRLIGARLFRAGESDGDEQGGPDHHYEALYEVINPLMQTASANRASANIIDPHEDSFEDSFEEDDPFEEDVVRGPVTRQTERD